MRKIPFEQPPIETEPRLKEWLSRLVVAANIGLDEVTALNIINQLPPHSIDGMIKFFGQPIAPDIEYAGPWIQVGGEWRPMTSMFNRGAWENGRTYFPQDVVYDGQWTMSANKETDDRPAPQPPGQRETTLPDTPVWGTNSTTANVFAAQSYSFTESGWLNGVDVWIPDTGPDITHRVFLIDNTDNLNPKLYVVEDSGWIPGEWNVVGLGAFLTQIGSEYIIYLDSIDSGSSTLVTGSWESTGSGIRPPIASEWARTRTNRSVKIARIDLDLVDRSTELLGVQVGTDILVSETADPSNFRSYRVNATPIIFADYYEFPVAQIDSTDDLPSGTICTVLFDIPVPAPIDYVELVNYWPTNNPTWADINGILQFDGVDQPGSQDSAFGIRISYTPAVISEDWDFVAYSDSLNTGLSGISAANARKKLYSIVATGKRLSAGSTLGFGSVPQGNVIQYVIPMSGRIVICTIGRTDSDLAAIDIKVNSVVEKTVVTNSLSTVEETAIDVVVGDFLEVVVDTPSLKIDNPVVVLMVETI